MLLHAAWLVASATALNARPPLIIFGRPGAGKTTIAEALVADPKADCYGVDLDVCVPQWMRDNFAKGIYPTLDERRACAATAAEHVLAETADGPSRCVVSFSFVNQDLRDYFQYIWCATPKSSPSLLAAPCQSAWRGHRRPRHRAAVQHDARDARRARMRHPQAFVGARPRRRLARQCQQ